MRARAPAVWIAGCLVSACGAVSPVAPSPDSSPALYTYSGLVSDGRGLPVASVSITAGDTSTVSGSNGRYVLRSERASLNVLAVIPPSGYEGGFSGYETMTPGERTLVVRRITRVTIQPPATVPVSDGTRWYGVSATAEFDTGAAERLTGAREDLIRLTSSNPAVLSPRRDGDRPVVEGLSRGTASVTAIYWGVESAPVTIQVRPR
jgi:hypothetical protein